MSEVLITGFLPETDSVENASAHLLTHLQRRPGMTWGTAVLPQDSAALRLLIPELLVAHQPTLTILCGQAPGRNRLALEAIALNVMHFGVPDVRGFSPRDEAILPEAPLALRTTLPVHSAVERLKAGGFPAQVSLHAGAFLCNQAYFLALHHLLHHGESWQRVLFLHLPLAPSQVNKEKAMADKPCLPTEFVAQGLNLLVATLQAGAARDVPAAEEVDPPIPASEEQGGLSTQERWSLLP